MRSATLRRCRKAFLLLGATAALLIAPPASSQAALPWWTLEAGSRPSNLEIAPDQSEIQEVTTSTVDVQFFGTDLLVAPIRVGGSAIGCIGVGEFTGLAKAVLGTPATVCEKHTGFPASETVKSPADLGNLLASVYGDDVQLSGPAGFAEGPLTITTPGRWVPRLEIGPPIRVPHPAVPGQTVTLGSAFSEVTSEASGRLFITATNVGNAPVDGAATPLRVAAEIPKGVVAYAVEGFAGLVIGDVANGGGSIGISGPVRCTIGQGEASSGGDLVSCEFEGELPSYEALEIEIHVALTQEALDGSSAMVRVSGGGAEAQTVQPTLRVTEDAVQFGIDGFSMRAEEEGGATASLAGSHPFQLTQSLLFNAGRVVGRDRANTVVEQPGQPRNLRVSLPQGFVGNASRIEACTFQQFTTQGIHTPPLVNECPAESAIGAASVTVIEPGAGLRFTRVAVPIFNLVPAFGEPARFGFMVAGVPVVIDTEVRPDEGYAINAKVLDASQLPTIVSSTVSIWGNPADPSHDSTRGWGCLYFSHPYPCSGGALPGGVGGSFLRLPVSCEHSVRFGIEIEPWDQPGIASALDETPPLTGCDLLPFDPEIRAVPTTRVTASPSGLDLTLKMPNSGLDNPRGRSEAQARKIEVTLPPGMTANPALAEGLTTCSEAQFHSEGADSRPGEGCPEASKIGAVELETPLLEGRLLKGSVFVATPYQNPSGSLLALYMTIREPRAGIIVTQPLEVRPDPQTGRLTTVADDVPQLPFSELRVHFREGGRAPLATPPACGTWLTEAVFYPFSISLPVVRTSPSQIISGPDGGACPTGGLPPFRPELTAGTVNNAGGSFSPFNLRITRVDDEQEFTNFSIKLPPGLAAKLAGVPFCSDAQIAQAAARTGPHGGAEELADPSCPAAAQVGRTLAGAGVGSALAYAPGKIYLAGPYHGAPISFVAITSGVVGPFDIGTVVVRLAIDVNPETGEVFLDSTGSDPIPHIIKGIPVHLRDIRAYTDRPEFTFNPTSCEETSTAATVLGSGLDFASPADDNPFVSTSRFQAADCAALRFGPRISFRLKGGTRRGAHPSLRAHVKMSGFGEAAIARAQVTLPRSEFLEQSHIRTVCTRVQFNSGAVPGENCPRDSIYGRVRALTPILDGALEGPIFLRSSEHKLPDLVAALHHQEIDIALVGRVDSVRGGQIRNTFEVVPDAPVTSADFIFGGGNKSLLVNSTNICRGSHRVLVNLKGHNGKQARYRTPLRARCGRHRKRRHKRHLRRGAEHSSHGRATRR